MNASNDRNARTDDDQRFTPALTIDHAGMIVIIIIVALTIGLSRLMPAQPLPQAQPVYAPPVIIEDHRTCIIVQHCN